MVNETLPPLCTSALGAIVLLVAAGILPWPETVLLLSVIAVFHFLPLGIKQLNAERAVLVRTTKPSVLPPHR